MKPEIAIVADDLTGALDAAVPFVTSGRSVCVAVSPDDLAELLLLGSQVVAVATNTREGSATAASAVVARVGSGLSGVTRSFKKVDSRLKGHVSLETVSLAQTMGLTSITLCPAIPEMGRTVTNGQLTGFGVAAPIPVRIEAVGPGITINCPDAATDSDLDAIVALAGPDCLLTGARGLAAALARSLAPVASPSAGGRDLPGPILFAIGSRDPITVAQVGALCAARPDIDLVEAPNSQVPHFCYRGRSLIVQMVPGPDRVPDATAGGTFADGIAELVRAGFSSVVLTGGETAAAVLARLEIGLLRLVGEAQPGLPVSIAANRTDGPCFLTKSGGFGASDALVRLATSTGRG